jgi:plasmid stabilization system protein ParE
MPNKYNKYKVSIQDAATEMLIQHARFLAQVGEAAEERLTEEFFEKAKTLEKMPERCLWLFDPHISENKYRKLVFAKCYILVFQVIGTDVFVDAMVDCRQDYIKLL